MAASTSRGWVKVTRQSWLSVSAESQRRRRSLAAWPEDVMRHRAGPTSDALGPVRTDAPTARHCGGNDPHRGQRGGGCHRGRPTDGPSRIRHLAGPGVDALTAVGLVRRWIAFETWLYTRSCPLTRRRPRINRHPLPGSPTAATHPVTAVASPPTHRRQRWLASRSQGARQPSRGLHRGHAARSLAPQHRRRRWP